MTQKNGLKRKKELGEGGREREGEGKERERKDGREMVGKCRVAKGL